MTATKRREKLQSVPVAVSAFTATQLRRAGIVSSVQLSQVTPGLNIQSEALYVQPAIRGVVTTATGLGDEPNVATYVDGVYLPSPTANLLRLADVDRIEVLKGPQGTLFGRNATGGALNVVTRDPSFAHALDASLSYGRYNQVEGNLYASGGLTHNLAASFSLFATRDDGYYNDINLHRSLASNETIQGRGKLLWEPLDNTRITASFDYGTTSNNQFTTYTIFGADTITRAFVPNEIIATRPYESSLSFVPKNVLHNYGGYINLQSDFDRVSLVSITGARHSILANDVDLDNSPANYLNIEYGQQSDSVSEDIRLQSRDSSARFTWTAGLFGFFDRDFYHPFNVLINPDGNPNFSPPVYVESQTNAAVSTLAGAIYGQANYKLTRLLTFTAGVRLSEESKHETYNSDMEVDRDVVSTTPEGSARKTFYDTSPLVTVSYQLLPRTKLYATYTKGFKSGAYNPVNLSPVAVNPEKLFAYETGVKTDITDNLRLNLAGFYYDYKDLQVQAFTGNPSSTTLENAATATAYGIEAELFSNFANVLARNDILRLTGGLAYLYSKYDSYPNAPLITLSPGGLGGTFSNVSAAGDRLVEAPRFTFNGGVNYQQVYDFGTMSFAGNAYFNSGYANDPTNSPLIRQPAYTVANVSLTWTPPHGHYEVTLWGRNISSAKQFSIPVLSTTTVGANYIEPATYGFTLRYRL